jgi:CheY-like chemotaxis protein
LHGGRLQVESDASRGTVFTIRLPVIEMPAAAGRLAEDETDGRRPRRVLVVEDNEDAAESLREALELHGHRVAIARDGPEGIEAARRLSPDLVLCDVGLPRMDGYEVARHMRADPELRALPLVALSGYAGPEDVARASEAGFDRHVAKPPSLEELDLLIAELADGDADGDTHSPPNALI